MIDTIRKRNGELVDFKPEKITWALFKAAHAVGGDGWEKAQGLCDEVVKMAEEKYPDSTVDVEQIQDLSLIHIFLCMRMKPPVFFSG